MPLFFNGTKHWNTGRNRFPGRTKSNPVFQGSTDSHIFVWNFEGGPGDGKSTVKNWLETALLVLEKIYLYRGSDWIYKRMIEQLFLPLLGHGLLIFFIFLQSAIVLRSYNLRDP